MGNPLLLPDSEIAKLRNEGLVVEGPWQKGARGWLGRFTIARGPWIEYGGISLLPPPILWIYEKDGFWFAEKREGIPVAFGTDFQCTFPTANGAVGKVLQFFRAFPRDNVATDDKTA